MAGCNKRFTLYFDFLGIHKIFNQWKFYTFIYDQTKELGHFQFLLELAVYEDSSRIECEKFSIVHKKTFALEQNLHWFPVNFPKYIKAAFLLNTSDRLLLLKTSLTKIHLLSETNWRRITKIFKTISNQIFIFYVRF